MFRTRQLIVASALTLIGCNGQPELPINDIQPAIVDSIVIEEQWDGLSSIDATLAIADAALEQKAQEEQRTRNVLSNLRVTIVNEEAIIDSMNIEVGQRDSLIAKILYESNYRQYQLDSVSAELAYRMHICTSECTPTISQLKIENKQLTNYIKELQSQIEIMDSLLMDNRKTRKIYEPTTGRSF
jgi:hypothetical protein